MEDEDLQKTTDEAPVFDLTMADSDLLSLVRGPIKDSEDYWNNTFKLKKVRESNVNLWLPNHWKNKDVYDYQEDYLYQDNRIFTSVETICSVVNARIPQPEVMPAQDNVVSEQVAKDLQQALYAHSEKYRVADVFRIGTRNLLLKRVGFIKPRFDPNIGENGDIVPDVVMPEDVVVDQDARYGDVPRFIAQKLRNKTGEELLALFSDNKDAVYKLMDIKRTNKAGDPVVYKSHLGKKFDIWEVWFRYYDTDKEQYGGGLAFVDSKFQVVLGKMRNPNWNYTEKEGSRANLLDFPAPPFIPINYLNDGTSYIDLTTMVEQAAPLQRVLDKRGFQIMENAEQGSGGRIYNTQMITKEEIAKLTGSPDESVGVKGDVRSAVMRDTPPPLAAYVIEDKEDARNEIDNIFATHDISRGQQSNNKTLGQDQLQQQQDYTRMDDIARAVERAAAQYYRYVAQMMKVYYTEDHWFRVDGEDGQFDYIVIKSDTIEDGIDVRVETGSTMPVNKRSQLDFVSTLAQEALIDPLSLYEVGAGGSLPSPKKMLERYLLFKTDPGAFQSEAKSDDFDRYAFMDMQVLNAGKMPKPRENITPEYLKFMNEHMVSGTFDAQPDLVKNMYVEWMKLCTAQAQKQLAALQSQLPTPEDMQNANNQAVQQAQTEQAIMGGAAPQQPANPLQPGAQGQPPQGLPQQPLT